MVEKLLLLDFVYLIPSARKRESLMCSNILNGKGQQMLFNPCKVNV